MTSSERTKLMWKFAQIIEDNVDGLAYAESISNGKLLKESLAVMRAIPNYFRFYAGLADKLVGEAKYLPDKPNILHYTLRDPLGVVAIIVPWNSPLIVLTFSMAPALAAGNTIVAKPSELAPLSSLELMRLAEKAGFPPGVMNVLTGFGATGQALVKNKLVRKISFTGGTATGKAVACGASENLASCLLELGGKSPQIIFSDADLESAVNGIISGIVASSGQGCTAGSRVLVQEDIYRAFLQRVIERFRSVKLGDPFDPATQMGPLVSHAHFEKVTGYIESGIKEGAQLEYGGKAPSNPDLSRGNFLLPTVFSSVTTSMKIWTDEIFGPVMCVAKFSDEDQALKLANDSRYGLAAGLWTRDISRAHRIARDLQVGSVWINTFRVTSYSSAFGGYKSDSGYGRQLGIDAVREFTQMKSIWVNLGGRTSDPFLYTG